MKKLILSLITVALVTVTAFSAIPFYSQFATTGSSFGGGSLTNCAIIGSNSQLIQNGGGNGTPVITYLNCQSASPNAVVQFYKCTNQTSATIATTNTRTNTVVSTNGFSAGTVVVVKHSLTDTYERLLCVAPPATTNIAFASDPVTALAVGDIIYQQTTTGTIPVVTNNAGLLNNAYFINIAADGIYSGQKGLPLLLEMVTGAGTNGSIKAVNAKFVP